jgi:ion channel
LPSRHVHHEVYDGTTVSTSHRRQAIEYERELLLLLEALQPGANLIDETRHGSNLRRTTVGYGDLYPSTVAGRIVGIVLMFVGIGFLAVLTATIASYFVKSDRQDETSEILDLLRRLETDVADLKARG